MAPIYIVIPTTDIGGAEKRFAGLWQHLRRSGTDIHLVITDELHTRLREVRELGGVIEHGNAVHTFAARTWRRGLTDRLRAVHDAEPRAILHYVMVSPV